MYKYEYDHTSTVDLYNEPTASLELKIIPLLQAILYQAIQDAIKYGPSNIVKLEATRWLCDEDDRMLQLCLQVVNIDHSRILKKVAQEGWNLDL
jgi:hypothetical protein